MEDGIYRMSATENFLVLIVIGLWIVAVINLAKKLERICNPPSIYLNYSMHSKTNLSQSTYHQQYSHDSVQPTRLSSVHLLRATSEPTIDASPRTTILIRSPSETFAQVKSSISRQTMSPSSLDLVDSQCVMNLPTTSTCQMHNELLKSNLIQAQKLINPRRIPSIVRRSLLDLHRRALTSNRYIVTTTKNRTMAVTNGFPLMKKKNFHREHTIDEDIC